MHKSSPGVPDFIRLFVVCNAMVFAVNLPAAAQEPPGAQSPVTQAPSSTQADPIDRPLRIFMDCQGWCDEEFLRTEVKFVDHVRDRKDADLHVLVTVQGTGGGGTNWTLKFIGLGRFAGVDDTLPYASIATATQDEQRRGFLKVLKVGLMRYVGATPLRDQIQITFTPSATAADTAKKRDPWNYWFFRTNFGGNFGGERSNKRKSVRGSFSANRTTEAWKISLSTNANYSENTFELSETETFTSISRNLNADALVVKSLTDHWSAGLVANANSSTFFNYQLKIRFAPGVEYDIFPYSQSTRRRLTFKYTVGVNSFGYREETIFGKLSERKLDQTLDVSLSLRQPWGSSGAGVQASHYLDNVRQNRLTAFGFADVRLFKGFTFNVFADIGRIRDQLYLPKGGATPEEILVRQTQLATSYRYSINFGISYSFGSIFNNIVNPRFTGGDFFFFQ